MDLLVIRHAVAGDRVEFAKTGRPDAERPVTAAGAKKMRKAARGLRSIVPAIDVLATSPLTRARQTAAIVAKAYGGPDPIELTELAPEAAPAALLGRLDALGEAKTVAIVGHEPALSVAVSVLLAKRQVSLLELKKGAACLLRCPAGCRPGTALLVWSLAPRHLRGLAT